MFSHWSSHRVAPIVHCAHPTLVVEQVTAHFVDPTSYSLYAPSGSELACFRQQQEEKRSTCDRVIHLSLILSGAMASSAVSSVLCLRDAAGNHAETRTGAYIYYGHAACFHEWEFRTRIRVAGKTGDQYIEAMSKVCDGLRGDAFVAAQEVGLDNLCEIVDGRPCGIDTLIEHMRGMGFPLTEHVFRDDDVAGHS